MEEVGSAASAPVKSGVGCGPAAIFIAILIIAGILFGTNSAIGFYFENCVEGEDLLECIMGVAEEEAAAEGAVTATGTYTLEGFEVVVTANIPLEGGSVTGSISGTCNGKLTGSFDGKDNGVITGKLNGTCAPFVIKLPASADFSGTVNKEGKVVPIGFTGKGPGLTHEGSMSLNY